MASPIEDVNSLPGESLHDQVGQKIGTIKDVYGTGDDGDAMWVTVEASTGLVSSRMVFVPVSRLKHEDDQVRVPYSAQRIERAPEVDPADELSPEDDRRLRDFYAIDLADQEVRTDNDSYAERVPDGDGPARRLTS